MAIYKALPYTDLLTMRLINHQFKSEVEEHVDFHLKFDQTNTTRLRKLLHLRLKSCHIVHFTSRRLFRNGNITSTTAKVFSHPLRIKKLTFDGSLSTTNLLRIINQCTSVEHLIFTHQTLGLDGVIDTIKFDRCILQQRLASVTHLNLQLLRYPQGDPFETEENIEAFLRSTFPRLLSFRLYFSLWGNFSTLLPFLERHRGSLKELELQVGDRGDSYNTETYLKTSPLRIPDNLRRNLLSLKLTKFRFRDDVLNLNAAAKDLIMGILLEQKQLQVLQFYSPGELSWNMLTSVITTNESYLTEVVVYNIQSNVGGGARVNPAPAAQVQVPEINMDMSVFSKCNHLKTLALSCSSSNGNDPNVIGSVIMKMTNLHRISSSIERLHLTGFTLDGEELCMLSQKEDNSFKEVLIADAGTMKYSDVLNSFLKNCQNLSYLNVRPVILQAATDQLWWKEVGKLTKLYERFMGIQYDPIDDLEGFEANINESDKEWLKTSVPSPHQTKGQDEAVAANSTHSHSTLAPAATEDNN